MNAPSATGRPDAGVLGTDLDARAGLRKQTELRHGSATKRSSGCRSRRPARLAGCATRRAQRSARPGAARLPQPGQLYGTTPGCMPPTGRRSGLPAMSTGSRLPTTSLSVRSSGGSSPWRRATSERGSVATDSHSRSVSIYPHAEWWCRAGTRRGELHISHTPCTGLPTVIARSCAGCEFLHRRDDQVG